MTGEDVIRSEPAAEAPDPGLAALALERVSADPRAGEILASPDLSREISRLLGLSSAAADFLVQHPEETLALIDPAAKASEDLRKELSADVEARGDADGLRLFRRRAMFRVAARDLWGAPYEEVVAEITAIAEVCLEQA